MNLPDDLWTKVNIEFQRDAEDGVQGAGANVRVSHGLVLAGRPTNAVAAGRGGQLQHPQAAKVKR